VTMKSQASGTRIQRRGWRNNRESKDLLNTQRPRHSLSSGFDGGPSLRRRGLGFCREHTGDDGTHSSRSSGGGNVPIARAHRWAPIAGAHRLGSGHPSWAPTGKRRVPIRGAHRWRSKRPSGAVIGGRPYPIAAAHRPATGGGGPSAAIFGRGIGAAPRRGDRCSCGSIFGVAVCTHRGCSWGRRRAVIGGSHRGRLPQSCALIRGGDGGQSGHSERGEEIDPGDEVTNGQTVHFLQKDFE
jgi:hypothetical protein